MSQTTPTIEMPEPKTPAGNEDLSKAIDGEIEKEPDEEVRTVRVFEDRYRCNWWVRPKSTHWLSFMTGRISRSSFLKVTKGKNGKLLIERVKETPRAE